MKTFMTAWLLVVWVLGGGALGAVDLQEGRYSGLTVAFSVDMPQPSDPTQLMADLKNFLTAGSSSLSGAVGSGLAFGNVTVVVPRGWNLTSFENSKTVKAPTNLSPATADILVHNDDASLPGTTQSELCGVPARQISIPLSFLTLTDAQQQQYGTPGNILAHEWAHYRWGVHDEHGYGGDAVYSSTYGSYQVTACSAANATVQGKFRSSCPDGNTCTPGSADCYFCFREDVTAEDVQASLGYMPALSLGQFCNHTTHVRDTPTPQNALCGQRSVMEVIQLHSDYTRMAESSAADLEMVVVREAMGRVMFLFDTPTADDADVEIVQSSLLTVQKEALLSYGEVEVAMASYRDDGNGTQLYNVLDFATVTADNYEDLLAALPTEEPRVAVPDLGEVVAQVLARWEDYAPGTLLVLPVNNELIAASTLDRSMGEALHAKRIKPLFIFPEREPLMVDIASFLQYSGARFVFNNETRENEYMSSVWSVLEVQKFMDYGYVNDHPIVKEDALTITKGGRYVGEVLYQEYVARTRVLVVRAPSVEGLQVKYLQYGVYTDCDTCVKTADTILLQLRKENPSHIYGTTWGVEIVNSGTSDVDAAITWSEEYFVDKTDELDVRVWSSEGRGPVANMYENQNVVLYASVMNYGKQVLRTRVQVKVDLTIVSPDGQESTEVAGVELLDDGVGVDIRRDDSVYSVDLSSNITEIISENSVIRVNTLYVLGNNLYGFRAQDSLKSPRVFRSSSKRGSQLGSGLHPRDPSEEECCGSFVESPDIELSHNIAGFHLVLRDVVPVGAVPGSGTASSSITLTRNVDPSMTTTTSTTTTSTTTTSTTTAPATEKPTNAPTTTTSTTTTTTTTPTTTTTTTITTDSPVTDRGAPTVSVQSFGMLVVALLLLLRSW